jgi:hypothetical protein
MNPDLLYTTRKLQEADLSAEAMRKALIQEAVRGDQTAGDAMSRRWLFRLAAGSLGLFVVSIIVIGNLLASYPARATATPRALNRVFIDEMRYTPTIEEYVVLLESPLAVVPNQEPVIAPAVRSEGAFHCRVTLLSGMMVCLPQEAAPIREQRQQRGGPH